MFFFHELEIEYEQQNVPNMLLCTNIFEIGLAYVPLMTKAR